MQPIMITSTTDGAPQGSSLPPRRAVVVGVGSCCVDLLGTVPRFPSPDDKTRTSSMLVHAASIL